MIKRIMLENMIVQIYEIQTPEEAEKVLALGVDHLGSVILQEGGWHDAAIRDTVRIVQAQGARSCLIPLYNSPDAVFRTLDYHGPDIVHFCESLPLGPGADKGVCRRLLDLQKAVRKRFPEIAIMRSIPIPPQGMASRDQVLTLAKGFEAVSDWFLTDTLCMADGTNTPGDQPVTGFVGITGQTCDWDVAAALAENSAIPVILAGGLSPENVFQGCLAVAPAGVDSCTRTNALDSDGRPIRFCKDLKRVARFVSETRRAARTVRDIHPKAPSPVPGKS